MSFIQSGKKIVIILLLLFLIIMGVLYWWVAIHPYQRKPYGPF